MQVEVYDPWADIFEAKHNYGLTLMAQPEEGAYDAIILAVAHTEFKAFRFQDLRVFGREKCIVYDLKCVLPTDQSDLRL